MSSGSAGRAAGGRLGYALKRAQHMLRLAMDEALRPLHLTTPQYAVLCAVEAEDGLSNAELARLAFVTAQTMQGVLANLERDRLLERRPARGGGRALGCTLTPAGRVLVVQAHDLVAVVEAALVRSLDGREANDLVKVLSTCADDLAAS